MSRSLEGKVAVVTGAGGGIGSAVARKLAELGTRVTVNDVDEARAKSVTEDITRGGGRARTAAGDVSDAATVNDIMDDTVRAFGRIDVVVNTAGLIGQVRHFLDADEEWWDRVLRVNLRSVFLCSHAAAKYMVEQGSGVIISTSSGGATRAHRGEVAYDASKGGIEAMTRALAVDLAPYGIRVNAVSPGSINVAPPGAVSAEELAERGRTVPLGRVGIPDDLASAYAFLASDEAAYITGVVVPVDGGMIIQQRSPQVDIFGLDRYPAVGLLSGPR
ncbi:short-chain dehydrogenase [Spongiactinospora rosea]|uniref:Short-chain dehydrogenase n=1 Tax=Spongiactinospora rosea TaxID=2248750 RepID=A0A366LZH4_9ACTN|nr:glucose 1-dehydrogenase [Spongiactinospora rosea]RBQ19378.1 short-chain dehydrogenase [Spongiactinospora rosea]